VTRPGPLLTLACVGAAIGTAAALVVTAPDPTLPKIPGAVNPNVTQANIHQTICVRGWTATIRPPVSYTGALKRRLAREQGVSTRDFELDHFQPLELGGAPRDPLNLWLEPWGQARKTDQEENRLRREVCAGQETLARAQHEMADWKEKHG
jgi:hypothetical protein